MRPQDGKKEVQKVSSLKDFTKLIHQTKPPYLIMAIAMVFSLVTTGIGLVIPMFTKNLVDGFSLSSLDAGQIAMIVGGILAQAVGSALAAYGFVYIGQRVVAGLRDKLWKKQLALNVGYYDNHPTGDLISRITNDTQSVKTLVAEDLSQFVGSIITAVGSLIFLFVLDWQMTLIMLLAIPVAVMVFIPLGRIMRKIAKETMSENAKFTTVLSQVLSEVRLVKASNAEPREYAKGKKNIDGLFGFGLKEGRVQAVVAPIMGLIMMALLVLIVGYSGVRVSSGELTAGELVAYILYLVQVIMPVTQISQFFTHLQRARGATESIIAILNEPEELPDSGIKLEDARQTIALESVNFAYKEENPIIQDLSFTLEPGTVTAIVGPSGGGKTTLFSLLERFYKPQSGNITIGGVPAQDYSLSSWRSHIGYVSQDSPLMAGTIRENICYGIGRGVGDEELRAAARMAYADEFVMAFPQGYDSEVGERGIKLSGGQKQRIAIARALLRNPTILMLDEATSSLDSASEVYVQKALQNLMEGRTTVVIAHRLSTVVEADRIIFIEKGRVTGSGTHEELVKSHDMYRSFAVHQLRIKDELAAVTPLDKELVGA